MHRADGFSVFDDDERGQILVDDTGGFGAERFDCGGCRFESATFAVNVGVKAAFDHIPVCEISVHRNRHTSAARRDFCRETIVVQFRHRVFKHIDVLKRARCGNVAPVKQDVYENFFDAVPFRALDKRDKVVYVAVYVAVGQKPQKMHCAAVCHAVVFEFLPRGRIENFAAFDGFFHKFCALRIDLSATECLRQEAGI